MQIVDYGAAYSLLLLHYHYLVFGQAHLGSGAFCENLKTMSHICLPVLTSGKKDSNWCLQEKKLNKEIPSLWIFTYKFPHLESLLGIPSAFHREQFLHNCREKCVKKRTKLFSPFMCNHPVPVCPEWVNKSYCEEWYKILSEKIFEEFLGPWHPGGKIGEEWSALIEDVPWQRPCEIGFCQNIVGDFICTEANLWWAKNKSKVNWVTMKKGPLITVVLLVK